MRAKNTARGLTRRGFCGNLASGLGAAAVSSALPAASWARVIGSNEAFRVGVVGLHGRGADHIAGFRRLADVRVTALCDVDSAVLDHRVGEFQKDGGTVQAFGDVRKLLDAGVCDAISVATPNHTHALLGAWAAERGVHSYVEKPLAHDVWQGRQLVAAAARHKVCVQTGSQCRSMRANRDAIAFLRSGELGRIRLVRGLCYKPRQSIGKVPAPLAPPTTVDYDLWLGPAPHELVRRKQFHYDWHWQWNYGNGDLGNQGVHQMDLARWILGVETLPPRVLSFGGRLGYEDDGETPNTLITWLDYAAAPILFEVRGLPTRAGSDKMDRFLGAGIGVVVHCDDGYVVLTAYDRGHACDLDGKVLRKFEGGGDHFANFVAAARAGDPQLLNADAHTGHLSAALCTLGNASYREGGVAEPDAIAERLRALPELGECLLRVEQHLRANGIDCAAAPTLRLGALLHPTPDGHDRPRPEQREGFRMPESA